LAKECLSDVESFNIVDESLLKDTIRENRLLPATSLRLLGHIHAAEAAGAAAILVTCSSVGPAVDAAQPFVSRPVLRVDEPMVDEAIRLGRKIGVLATLRTTLEPTAELVRRRAHAAGVKVVLVERLCEGAFEAVVSGDVERHDAIVSARMKELVGTVDVIVLAQASMARVAESLPEADRRVPILSSPRLGVQRLGEVLRGS
jgi:Asp/Glu/hydantoin racemase